MEQSNGQVMLRAEEVCRLFGWNAGQLYMAVRRGHVPARKMGRRVVFLRTELEAHLAQLPHVVEKPVAIGAGRKKAALGFFAGTRAATEIGNDDEL